MISIFRCCTKDKNRRFHKVKFSITSVILIITIIFATGCGNKANLEKKKVRSVVEKVLDCWKKGDYYSPLSYFQKMEVNGKDYQDYLHLFNVKDYQIVNVDYISAYKYEDAIVTVRVQSTTQGGLPIDKLWKFGLGNATGFWKLRELCEAENNRLEEFRAYMIQASKKQREDDKISDLKPEEKSKETNEPPKIISVVKAGECVKNGLFHKKEGDFDKALYCFDEAIKIDPDCAAAYVDRASIYLEKKELEQAFSDADKAIQIDPNLVEAYNVRGCVYTRQDDYEKAITDFTKAIEISPDNNIAYYNRAHVYVVTHNYDQAVTDYNKALKLGHEPDPDFFTNIDKLKKIHQTSDMSVRIQKTVEGAFFDATGIQKPGIIVEGILFDAKGKSSAIVNGRVVSEGDSVGSDAKVDKINEDSIDVIVSGQKLNIKAR